MTVDTTLAKITSDKPVVYCCPHAVCESRRWGDDTLPARASPPHRRLLPRRSPDTQY